MSPAAAASSSSSDLIDSRVSPAQLAKAVGALVAHAQKAADQASKTELLERDDHVWLTVGTKKISSVKKLKPAKMCVPLCGARAAAGGEAGRAPARRCRPLPSLASTRLPSHLYLPQALVRQS